MSRWVVLSGCSGGGKSTLLDELARRGFQTTDEPGRRIVREELRTGGQALPWTNAAEFARRCVDLAGADLNDAHGDAWVFFDRGLVDAATALRHHTGTAGCTVDDLKRYHHRVFLVPPWPELYGVDEERRLSFDDAAAEYDRLLTAYTALGYQIVVLPRTTVDQRIARVLDELGGPV